MDPSPQHARYSSTSYSCVRSKQALLSPKTSYKEYDMPHPHYKPDSDPIPLAYLITFRSYGTWLHGDKRGSTDRFHNVYGKPHLPPSERRRQYERALMSSPRVILNSRQRAAVEQGIRETCKVRMWRLWAFNIRTNHVHSVVSANCKAWQVLNALKANATRSLRQAGCWRSDVSPWAAVVVNGAFGLKSN